eukprot:scaffold68898_cov51-Phaeocystis_antarctica.AAC.1
MYTPLAGSDSVVSRVCRVRRRARGAAPARASRERHDRARLLELLEGDIKRDIAEIQRNISVD